MTNAPRAPWLLVLLLVSLPLSGCFSDDSPASPTEGERESRSAERLATEPGAESWNGTDRLALAHYDSDTGVAFAAGVCDVSPYPAIEMDRAFGRVLPGTDHIHIRAGSDLANMGLQPGYAIDDGPITWLEPAWGRQVNGDTTYQVDVDDAQLEQGGLEPTRWSFYHRTTYPIVDPLPECFTGANAGAGAEMHVEAVKGA